MALEYNHLPSFLDCEDIHERLLEFQNKYILVTQRIKLKDLVRRTNEGWRLDVEEGEKYTHVVGFIDKVNYKKRSYDSITGKTIQVSEVDSYIPPKYREDIKKLVEKAGFIGRVTFESIDSFIPLPYIDRDDELYQKLTS